MDSNNKAPRHNHMVNSKAVSFLSGYLIVEFVCLSFALPSFLFLFGVSISVFMVYASFLITVFSGAYLARKHYTHKVLVGSLAVFFIAMILSGFLSFLFFDVSSDGQTYHEEAIIQLAGGWNPAMERLRPANVAEKSLFFTNNHMAKASEIVESGIYASTHRIESGKLVNLLLMIAAFCFSLSCLLGFNDIKPGKAVFFSALAAFNPVAIYQSLTFYVDGNLASCILCLLCVSYRFYLKPGLYLGLILALLGVFMINIKFTALIYFVILAAGFLLIAFLERETVVFKKALFVFICSLILGILICGYNPYVLNYKDHGHPFYPIAGQGKFDLLVRDRPKNEGFLKMNVPEKFLVSLLSESKNIGDIKLKIPLTVRKTEIIACTAPDPRLGGFGPFFSGILILTFILLLNGLRDFRTNQTLYLVILIITVSVIINPEAWWARYVPQFWLIPVLTLIFLKFNKKNIWVKSINTALAILIFSNIAVITVGYVYKKARDSYFVYEQLKELAKMKMPLKVDFVPPHLRKIECSFRPNRVRLAEHHIQYIEVSNLSYDNSIALYGSQTRIQVN